MVDKRIEQAYTTAKEQYAAMGVDTEAAMKKLAAVPVSMHCWQGDDVGGFETVGAELSGGGIQATGNYPGKARTIEELRGDVEKAMRLIPGKHRLNLHACYIDNGGKKIDRNEMKPEHFQSWIDWGKGKLHGMDFNPTYFSHPKAADGFTLSHADPGIRAFWIEHGSPAERSGRRWAAVRHDDGDKCVDSGGYKDIRWIGGPRSV
jgi:L-rhamnose isomerase